MQATRLRNPARLADPSAEIFIAEGRYTTCMAKRGKSRKNFGAYMKGAVEEELALSTLGARVLISDIFDSTVTEKTRVSSVKAIWSMSGFTAASGDGPIVVGVAHSDYSDSEIELAIEQTGSWSQGDKIAREVAQRLVRVIGVFRTNIADAALGNYRLNEGKPITTKLNWTLITGQSLRLWAYNQGSSALTTGVFVRCLGHANLWAI